MDATTRRLVIAVGVVLVLALGLSAVTGGMMGTHMSGFGPVQAPGWMWGLGMGLGGLAMLLFWGALIVGIVLLIRALGGAESPQMRETALDVLKRRYAAGEITREQFEQARRDIES